MKKLNLEDIIKEYEKYGYTFLDSEYRNTNYSHKVKNIEGYIGFTSLSNLRKNNGVKFFSKNNLFTIANINKYIEINDINVMLISTKYTGARDRNLIFKCDCGNKFLKSWNDFKNGKTFCPKCGLKRKTQSMPFEYDYVVNYINSFDYDLLSCTYINCKEKITVKCNNNHVYNTTFDNFKNNKRCPICNNSKGESRISKWLDNNNITYKQQYKFKDCKNKKALPFDFYMEDFNIAIEYDGEFHYDNTRASKLQSKCKLKLVKKRDTIKNEYCRKMGIKLYRIPYFEFNNIDKILEHIFNKAIPSQVDMETFGRCND